MRLSNASRTRSSASGRSFASRVLAAPVVVYRWTAPFRVPRCRYHPTCSTYALEALRWHGALRGSWMAAGRLLRCHPWSPGGIDHVPEPVTRATAAAGPQGTACPSDQ